MAMDLNGAYQIYQEEGGRGFAGFPDWFQRRYHQSLASYPDYEVTRLAYAVDPLQAEANVDRVYSGSTPPGNDSVPFGLEGHTGHGDYGSHDFAEGRGQQSYVEQGLVERLRRGGGKKAELPKTMTCLATTGAVVVAGTPSETCRAPKPNTAAWTRIVDSAKKTLKAHGTKLGKQVGCGSFGCAFAVDGRQDVIVKITGDRAEAAAATTVLEAVNAGLTTWEELHAVARLYCCFVLLDGCDNPLPVYIITQERIAHGIDGPAVDLVNDYWTLVLDMAEGGAKGKKARRELMPYAESILGDEADQLERLAESIRALHSIGVEWHDLHSGNVMVAQDGSWRIVDLGFGRSPDVLIGTVRSPFIEKLQR